MHLPVHQSSPHAKYLHLSSSSFNYLSILFTNFQISFHTHARFFRSYRPQTKQPIHTYRFITYRPPDMKNSTAWNLSPARFSTAILMPKEARPVQTPMTKTNTHLRKMYWERSAAVRDRQSSLYTLVSAILFVGQFDTCQTRNSDADKDSEGLYRGGIIIKSNRIESAIECV